MKTIKHQILILLCISLYISGYSQEKLNYYYYQGKKIFLELDTKTIALTTEGDNSPQEIQSFWLNASREKLKSQEDNTRRNLTIIDQLAQNRKDMKTYYLEITTEQLRNKEEYHKQIDAYKKIPSVVMASPCFVSEEGKKMGLSNTFYVNLKNSNDVDLLYNKAKEQDIEVLGYNELLPLWFVLSCNKETAMNAMEAANLFYETGLFTSAEPNFTYRTEEKLTTYNNLDFKNQNSAVKSPQEVAYNLKNNDPNNLKPLPINDPYSKYQWGLKNVGLFEATPGIDIKVEQAWKITKGSPNIKIAVIDSGFEMDHPDLKDNILKDKNGTPVSYDVYTNSSPAKVYGPHGTVCAGVIGAVQNNKIGISGVAPGSKLMSVSIQPMNVLSDGLYQLKAMFWPSMHGADVLNNSWHNNISSDLIDNAIAEALTKGRDGKGSVVVFTSGNDNKEMAHYPYKNNPLILVVGAIDWFGERWFDTYHDGTSIGSNYGDQLDVVAPGYKIATTDMQGKKGFNTQLTPYDVPDLNYTFIEGTSAAAPFVSGVAALVLSVNPELTAKEVNDIIEKSAQKIRPDIYIYSITGGRPNGTWNKEVGYGLVNAHAAVLLAQESLNGKCPGDLQVTGKRVASNIGPRQSLETFTESNSNDPNTDFQQSSGTLTASNTIASGTKANYYAKQCALLIPPFFAQQGSVVTIEAGKDCEGNNQRKINTLPEEKITYVFRYNTSENMIASNQLKNDKKNLKAEPNPFTHKIKISYQTTPDSGKVHIAIYSISGIKVANLLEQDHIDSGIHTIEWDATGFPSGTYLATFTTSTTKEDIKVIKL